MSEQKRNHNVFPMIGVLSILLVCSALPSPVLAGDHDSQRRDLFEELADKLFAQKIAGAYLVDFQILGPEGCCPVTGFRSVMMLTENGIAAIEFDVAPPEQDNSSGFGVWKRIHDGDGEGRRVKIRLLSFTIIESTGFDGEPVTTFRVTDTVDFDRDFQGFQGEWKAPLFCSNGALCGPVPDPLVAPDEEALVVIFGTLTARRITLDVP